MDYVLSQIRYLQFTLYYVDILSLVFDINCTFLQHHFCVCVCVINIWSVLRACVRVSYVCSMRLEEGSWLFPLSTHSRVGSAPDHHNHCVSHHGDRGPDHHPRPEELVGIIFIVCLHLPVCILHTLRINPNPTLSLKLTQQRNQ